MTLLIAGLHWPPETFLRRLIEGLLDAGVCVTVASPERASWAGRRNSFGIQARQFRKVFRLRQQSFNNDDCGSQTPRSAGFQTCRITDFQIGSASQARGVSGLGNPRYSRLGRLRYEQTTTQPRFEWLPTPAWEGNRFRRLIQWASLALRAGLSGAGNLHALRNAMRHPVDPAGHGAAWLREWNRLWPYAGRRWDVIYFPWNSAAIEQLPLFDWGMPVVVSCRGAQVSVAPHNPERADLAAGLRATFARARAVHCVSQAILQEAAGFGLDPAKAWVIRPAVDPDVFCPPPARRKPDGRFRVVMTGSLIWRKGYEWALSAIRRLRDRGVRVELDVVGEGPDRQRLLYTVHDLGIEDGVRFQGRQPEAVIRERLQQADAFLLSSLSEGLANGVLEAMACGLPVVTTDCGGMREAVSDDCEGYVVPVRNAVAIADALQRLAAAPERRVRMGQAGRARVLREFALAPQIDRWLELLQSATGSRPATPRGDTQPALNRRRQ